MKKRNWTARIRNLISETTFRVVSNDKNKTKKTNETTGRLRKC